MAQVELRDEYGNPVELTDAYGNPVWLTDEKGNPVHLTGVATIADHTLQTPQHIPLHSNPTSTLISVSIYIHQSCNVMYMFHLCISTKFYFSILK